MSKYLIDTNILIYHTAGLSQSKIFIEQVVIDELGIYDPFAD